ncbi:MAG: ADP-ribosylglycohydrolase family protein [Clostridiales Family XIII bacterium]|nr:ADP-ribosylglycohydrolase family protein [Clostridiales Family XIII bacterium]
MTKLPHNENLYVCGLSDHALWGVIAGDALGVPVEFKKREYLDRHPVTDFIGYGTFDKPPGTWSDDSSLTLALADSIASSGGKLDYADMMERFAKWIFEGAYTQDGKAFDVGMTTLKAISNYRKGAAPAECGGRGERDNGNGSLMRIVPLLFYLDSKGVKVLGDEGARVISDVSSLTHAHPRSRAACIIYLAVCEHALSEARGSGKSGRLEISNGEERFKRRKEGIIAAIRDTLKFLGEHGEYNNELEHFARMADAGFSDLPRERIKSSGYVVHTLEAALWCTMNTGNCMDALLAAVNLGGDTDTTAAVCGGLAGLYSYGAGDGASIRLADKIPNREVATGIIKKFSHTVERVGQHSVATDDEHILRSW